MSVGVVTAVTSAMTGAVVSEVVVSSEVVVEDELSVDADEPPSSLPQEIMVRLNNEYKNYI